MAKVPKVQVTTNYRQFKSLKGNRSIDPQHLQRLTNAVMKKNLLDVEPGVVNENKEVIDGQHRLEVASSQKLEFFFIQKEGLTIDDAVEMNISSRTWTSRDYLDSYAKRGFKEYQKVADFMKKYKTRAVLSAAILRMDREKLLVPKFPRKIFQIGKYHVRDEEGAHELVERIKSLKPFVYDQYTWKNREFVKTLFFLYYKHNVSNELLIEKLKISGKQIYKRATQREYLIQLEDVINFNRKKKRIWLL